MVRKVTHERAASRAVIGLPAPDLRKYLQGHMLFASDGKGPHQNLAKPLLQKNAARTEHRAERVKPKYQGNSDFSRGPRGSQANGTAFSERADHPPSHLQDQRRLVLIFF